jgi:hypothetical protein
LGSSPKNGYELNKAGDPVKNAYVPEIGEIIDRFGPDNGRFTSPLLEGAPYSYDKRSLPYVEDPSHYHQYVVTGDFTKMQHAVDTLSDEALKAEINLAIRAYDVKLVAHRGDIARGFGRSGGGIQIELPLKVEYMKKLGMIAEVRK